MKKVIYIILIFTILLLQFGIVNAANEEASAQITFTTPQTLPQDTKTFTAVLYVGNITNIGESKVVGFSATLGYNQELVESVQVEGKNGWLVSYSNGAIVASIDEIQANKEIAEFTFNLKDNINAGDALQVTLNDFNISNDDDLEQQLNFSKNIAFVSTNQGNEQNDQQNPQDNGGNKVDDNEATKNEITNGNNNQVINEDKETQENNKEDKTNKVQNEATNNKTSNNKTQNNTNVKTNTTKANATTTNAEKKITVLPKAGQNNIIIIAIVVIAVIGIICIIRSKSIKIK